MIWSFAITVVCLVLTFYFYLSWANISTAEDRMGTAFLIAICAAGAGLAGLITIIWFIIKALS